MLGGGGFEFDNQKGDVVRLFGALGKVCQGFLDGVEDLVAGAL